MKRSDGSTKSSSGVVSTVDAAGTASTDLLRALDASLAAGLALPGPEGYRDMAARIRGFAEEARLRAETTLRDVRRSAAATSSGQAGHPLHQLQRRLDSNDAETGRQNEAPIAS